MVLTILDNQRLLTNRETKTYATRDEREVVGYTELMDMLFSS